MIINTEQFQSIFDLMVQTQASIENSIAFMTLYNFVNINENIEGRTLNITALNTIPYIYSLSLAKKNIVTGSYFEDVLLPETNAFDNSYNEEFD